MKVIQMAKYRYVYCEFWEDPDMLEYTPEEKYFYLYLLTNPHTTQCGIYEISIKQMAFETGYNRDTIHKLIERFANEHKKIKYSNKTNEMAVINWGKYNLKNSGTPIIDCIKQELPKVKDKALLNEVMNNISTNKIKALYINELNAPYTPRGEKEKEKEKENKKEKEKENNRPVPSNISKNEKIIL